MTTIKGVLGVCGSREVFLGFAPASFLFKHSFADILDEGTGKGYQRRFNKEHSLEFRRYIQKQSASTIPLTFNLRPPDTCRWKINIIEMGVATLDLLSTDAPVLSQVDCQHRMGFMHDIETPLAFMTFIGLNVDEEMEVFKTINSKAKGLSSSLLDYHESRLTKDLKKTKLELYIALRLNENPESPWYQRLDLGGNRTIGMHRLASFRSMQKAVKRFLNESQINHTENYIEAEAIVLAFWKAVQIVLRNEWDNPRKYFLTKGIGVYSLMSIAADLYKESISINSISIEDFFIASLNDFAPFIDWSNSGPLRGYGGVSGAEKALEFIRGERQKFKFKLVSHG
jgi:DNA sulfur modification protein DndB